MGVCQTTRDEKRVWTLEYRQKRGGMIGAQHWTQAHTACPHRHPGIPGDLTAVFHCVASMSNSYKCLANEMGLNLKILPLPHHACQPSTVGIAFISVPNADRPHSLGRHLPSSLVYLYFFILTTSLLTGVRCPYYGTPHWGGGWLWSIRYVHQPISPSAHQFVYFPPDIFLAISLCCSLSL